MRFVAAVRAFRVVMRTRRITSIARSRALWANWLIDLFPRPARGRTVCMGSLSPRETRARSAVRNFMAGLQEAEGSPHDGASSKPPATTWGRSLAAPVGFRQQ